MSRKNGTQYESEWRDILRANGHISVLGSTIDVDGIDACHGILYEVKSSLLKTDKPHIVISGERLVSQYKKMREYSKKVTCRYVVRFRGKKWYYYDVKPDEPVPTVLEYIPDANVTIIKKGKSIKGILKPVEEMDNFYYKK